MLFWLASYPRSGNTLFLMTCRDRYAIPRWVKHEPPKGKPGIPPVKTLEGLAAFGLEGLVKTHELPDPDQHPAIYLLRDGRDVLVSYAHFAIACKKLAPELVTQNLFRSTLRDLLLEERSAYGTWAQNVRAWTARPNTVVVRYENLIQDPGREVDQALAKVNWPTSRVSEEVPTFEGMRKWDPVVVRRGVVGSWKDEFPPELLPLFWNQNGEIMRKCGYADSVLRKAA